MTLRPTDFLNKCSRVRRCRMKKLEADRTLLAIKRHFAASFPIRTVTLIFPNVETGLKARGFSRSGNLQVRGLSPSSSADLGAAMAYLPRLRGCTAEAFSALCFHVTLPQFRQLGDIGRDAARLVSRELLVRCARIIVIDIGEHLHRWRLSRRNRHQYRRRTTEAGSDDDRRSLRTSLATDCQSFHRRPASRVRSIPD